MGLESLRTQDHAYYLRHSISVIRALVRTLCAYKTFGYMWFKHTYNYIPCPNVYKSM